jgi:L-threonylcarbamoyladenylate synthase
MGEKKAIEEASRALSAGELVIYPTDTCYGLACDPTNPEAVAKLLEYKGKKARMGKPVSIAVSGLEMARKFVELNETALSVYKNFLPGPFTVVSKGKHKVKKGVESPLGTLGVRIPKSGFVINLVRKFGKPITATSANASKKKTPYTVGDVLETISGRQKKLLGLAVDAGRLSPNKPSTVIDTTLDDVNVLRQGDFVLGFPFKRRTESEEETKALAREIMQNSFGKGKCLVLALQGELGAGKTVFSKGIGEFLGIRGEIVSPTFTVSREYAFKRGGKKGVFYHIDCYRLLSGEELGKIGFSKMLKKGNVIAVEWAEKASREFKKHAKEMQLVWLEFAHSQKEKERNIRYEFVES